MPHTHTHTHTLFFEFYLTTCFAYSLFCLIAYWLLVLKIVFKVCGDLTILDKHMQLALSPILGDSSIDIRTLVRIRWTTRKENQTFYYKTTLLQWIKLQLLKD